MGRIEIPEDLTACSNDDLEALARKCDSVRIDALIALRQRAAGTAPVRPTWMRWLDLRFSGAGSRKVDKLSLGIALLVMCAVILPTMLQSCSKMSAQYEAAKKAARPPAAEVLK